MAILQQEIIQKHIENTIHNFIIIKYTVNVIIAGIKMFLDYFTFHTDTLQCLQ